MRGRYQHHRLIELCLDEAAILMGVKMQKVPLCTELPNVVPSILDGYSTGGGGGPAALRLCHN